MFLLLQALMTCCQDGYPARFKGAHIVNNSYIYNIIWAFGKPFLNQKVSDRRMRSSLSWGDVNVRIIITLV